jgi:hypothetical protein
MALLASLALALAVAQADSPSEAIVIQGTRPSRQQVRDFVRALTDVPSYGQIGRFHSRVCPAAMGLASIQNQRLVARMRQVGAAAGVPLAPEHCSANAFVIVAPDRGAAITELNRRFPAYFSQMSARQVRELAATNEPATAWQVIGLLSADGEAVPKAMGADYYTVRSVNTPSRIRAASKPTFTVSIVVIDVKAAAGLTLTQLADYGAMRTFADIDPDRVVRVGVPTILGVLGQPDDRPLPVTLTHWDLGFLKSLYATDNAYFAGHQRGDIEQIVKKEAAQPDE